MSWLEKVTERKQRRRRALIEAELRRINRLPRLDTSNLLRIPYNVVVELYGRNRYPLWRTFARQGAYATIFDEKGGAFLALLTREVIRGLRDAEYVPRSYPVPVMGLDLYIRARKVDFKVEVDFLECPLWFDVTLTSYKGQDIYLPAGDEKGWETWVNLLREFMAETQWYELTLNNERGGIPPPKLAESAQQRAWFEREYSWWRTRPQLQPLLLNP